LYVSVYFFTFREAEVKQSVRKSRPPPVFEAPSECGSLLEAPGVVWNGARWARAGPDGTQAPSDASSGSSESEDAVPIGDPFGLSQRTIRGEMRAATRKAGGNAGGLEFSSGEDEELRMLGCSANIS
jgi:hypothetical protein